MCPSTLPYLKIMRVTLLTARNHSRTHPRTGKEQHKGNSRKQTSKHLHGTLKPNRKQKGAQRDRSPLWGSEQHILTGTARHSTAAELDAQPTPSSIKEISRAPAHRCNSSLASSLAACQLFTALMW